METLERRLDMSRSLANAITTLAIMPKRAELISKGTEREGILARCRAWLEAQVTTTAGWQARFTSVLEGRAGLAEGIDSSVATSRGWIGNIGGERVAFMRALADWLSAFALRIASHSKD